MLWLATIPGVALMVGMQFAVESPRWLSKVCSLLFWWTGVIFLFFIACVCIIIFYIYLIPCFLSFMGYRYLRLSFLLVPLALYTIQEPIYLCNLP